MSSNFAAIDESKRNTDGSWVGLGTGVTAGAIFASFKDGAVLGSILPPRFWEESA